MGESGNLDIGQLQVQREEAYLSYALLKWVIVHPLIRPFWPRIFLRKCLLMVKRHDTDSGIADIDPVLRNKYFTPDPNDDQIFQVADPQGPGHF